MGIKWIKKIKLDRENWYNTITVNVGNISSEGGYSSWQWRIDRFPMGFVMEHASAKRYLF